MDFAWNEDARQWIEAGGKRLEARCFGPPPSERPTIVLLHEGLGCADLWRELPLDLVERTGCGVLAYSRAGYGRSDPCELPRPQDYMTVEAEQILPRVLDVAGIERCVLFGHSDGATIAAIYAGCRQDFKVRGLILMAPHFFIEDVSVDAISEARREYQTGDLRARLAKYHSDVDCAFYGWNDAWLNPEFQQWNVADVIDYWRVPSLVIHGSNDEYGTLAQIREIEMRSYAPVDVKVFSDCGHSPHIEKRQQTVSSVAEFMARLERIETTSVAI